MKAYYLFVVIRMKKISYKLKIAVIGKEPIGYDLILNCLKNLTIDMQEGTDLVFQTIHKSIPIKIHLNNYETMNAMLSELELVNGFDFLFLVLNIYNEDSLNDFEKELYDELCTGINFKGSSLLIALGVNSIKTNFPIDKIRISRHRLIRKCNELDLEYCFEIIEPDEDLNDLFKKILDESILKFKISNPELYEKVKEFGISLAEKVEKI